jgi:phage shock protein A
MCCIERVVVTRAEGDNDMALINRVSRLFTADFHAVLDRIEEPDVLLRQAVREMEDDLARAGQQIKRLARERDDLTRRQVDSERSLGDIEEQLDVCFRSGEEQLARTLIRRKLEAERLARELATRLTINEKELGQRRAAVEENNRRLESMRQKAELLGERADDESFDEIAIDRELRVSDEEVEVAFLREQQRRAQS